MATSTINLADASLEQLLEAADAHTAVTLSRCGQEVAVIVPIDEWKRLNPTTVTEPSLDATDPQKESMLSFLMRSPLWGAEDFQTPERDRSSREIDF